MTALETYPLTVEDVYTKFLFNRWSIYEQNLVTYTQSWLSFPYVSKIVCMQNWNIHMAKMVFRTHKKPLWFHGVAVFNLFTTGLILCLSCPCFWNSSLWSFMLLFFFKFCLQEVSLILFVSLLQFQLITQCTQYMP